MSLPKKIVAASALCIFCSFTLFRNNFTNIAEAKDDSVVCNTFEELQNALNKQYAHIKIGDIDFEEKALSINYNVLIESSDKQSTIKNGYFEIFAPNSVGSNIVVELSNIHFDGGVNPSDYNLNQAESFETIFGSDREANRCINATQGYFKLSLNNCVISNYASFNGAAIYTNNLLFEDEKQINLTNCKFFNNISSRDIVDLSNNKLNVSIVGCEFYSNYAYKGAGFNISNGKCVIDRVNVHDNVFCPFDMDQNNFQLAGGGVYLGSSVKMTNSIISNNETIYGGGMAVSSPSSGNNDCFFENITIKNNKAKHGGAVTLFSLVGQPISFVNCDFLNNESEEGSSLYTEVYAKHNAKNSGGLVELYFCTFGLNKADDTNTYSFYAKDKTKGELGTIELKGCLSIGNDTYPYLEDNYNYIVTKDQALLDGVITNESIKNINENGLYPIKGSKADIKVGPDIYKKWSGALSNHNETFTIGKNQFESNNVNTKIIIFIAGGSIMVIAAVILLILILRKKKTSGTYVQIAENNDTVSQPDMRQEYYNSLTDREKQVVSLMIDLKKRKEIADELNYSENTIKKDLTSIYSKLHVLDKFELMSQYKDIVKK